MHHDDKGGAMKRNAIAWGMILVALALSGCGRDKSTVSEPVVIADNEGESASFTIALRIPKVAIENVSRVEYVISASDIDTLRGDLTIGADDVARGTVTGVKAGTDRLVTLNAYNAAGEKTYTGSSITEVVAGETVTVRIVLRSLVSTEGDIDIEGTFGTEATFTLPGGATMEMVWIPAGTFTMGTTEEEIDALNTEYTTPWYSDEGPQHEVTITEGFYIGKYELTQEQWTSVMGTRPWSGDRNVVENPNHPAVFISWEDVQVFIAALNESEGSAVYRLPTEAEWEYACRAGTTTRWSFGDDESQLVEYAWYKANACDVGECYGHEVGMKRPNPWGLYDMHGNVYEWCQDWYGETYYSASPSIDPAGPSSGSTRVVRGGYFGLVELNVRSALRGDRTPDNRLPDFGVRLVRQEPQ
jgi:formylglycine-generating enzyme required for sulfatase activity